MTYNELIGLLGQFNLIAWIIAGISAFIILRVNNNIGWVLIMFGSVFVVLRQVWKFIPNYKLAQESDLLFNVYMIRYVFVAIGAILLCIGLIALITTCYVVKDKMTEE